MEFNLADLFENAVDHFGEREYLVCDGKRRTYGEMEERANRLAHHLATHGVGPGDHVGIYAYNSVEWVETLWAVFKLRAIWININYRYVEDELRYLFDNADLKALIYQAVRRVSPASRRHAFDAFAGHRRRQETRDGHCAHERRSPRSPERDLAAFSGDRYILYTGGTGMRVSSGATIRLHGARRRRRPDDERPRRTTSRWSKARPASVTFLAIAR
jgi:acyl-CoA synthetase (AMP-forming)/AMP-acid ligase II